MGLHNLLKRKKKTEAKSNLVVAISLVLLLLASAVARLLVVCARTTGTAYCGRARVRVVARKRGCLRVWRAGRVLLVEAAKHFVLIQHFLLLLLHVLLTLRHRAGAVLLAASIRQLVLDHAAVVVVVVILAVAVVRVVARVLGVGVAWVVGLVQILVVLDVDAWGLADRKRAAELATLTVAITARAVVALEWASVDIGLVAALGRAKGQEAFAVAVASEEESTDDQDNQGSNGHARNQTHVCLLGAFRSSCSCVTVVALGVLALWEIGVAAGS